MVQHNGVDIEELVDSFQYILCCGSTIKQLLKYAPLSIFQYILCCGSTKHNLHAKKQRLRISIHLMLWFNFVPFHAYSVSFTFQYILCCGSTCSAAKFTKKQYDFNTSYVVVQPKMHNPIYPILLNFNTSYVVVQQNLIQILPFAVQSFQYILCCGSTLVRYFQFGCNLVFQYILCCGSTAVLDK